MHFSKLSLLSLAALTPLASAVGKAIITNRCDFDVYVTDVGSTAGNAQKIAAGKSFSEPFRRDPKTGGIALKLTRDQDGLYTGDPQLNFAYALNGGGRLFYDLSAVFGDPFPGEIIKVQSSDGNCPKICWPNGEYPGGNQTHDCDDDANETLVLCAAKC
ncbi:hypothetical protein FE257_011365 [Aspergillus nanangensis]|uniref:BYS1 domain protein n=1 Tax=Aspergillus nanangensis TaxID=2582783 RepID=A0AAD4CH97_ASPNN|nr:hypothetical protein FE257_011365 [Aspergillus nanangensis]